MAIVFTQLIGFAVYAQDYSNQWNAQECYFEDLPSTLDSIAYLGLNGEARLFGEFFVNLTDEADYLNFTLTQTSYFNVYVGPHEVDVDLWLYKSSSPLAIAHSSLFIGSEEAIGMILQPGVYSLQFLYFGTFVGSYDPTDCDTITLELAISPKNVVDALSNSLPISCQSQQEIRPNIDFSPLENGESVQFYGSGFQLFGQSIDNNVTATRWAQAYYFTIPGSGKGTTENLWKIHTTLTTDFQRGGSIGMVLLANNTAPTLGCDEEYCTSAQALQANGRYLRQVLAPGQYTLWIFDTVGTRSVSGCTPFSFYLNITSVTVPENVINCAASNLPDVLIPGYDSPKGYLHFSNSVLMNLDDNGDNVNITVDSPSWVRVWTGAHRVDIDLKLIEPISQRVLAYSFQFRGDEMLAFYLDPAQYSGATVYTVNIVFYGTYDHIFCETYDIEIAVMTTNYALGGPNFAWAYNQDNTVRHQPVDFTGLSSAAKSGNSYSLPVTTGYFAMSQLPNQYSSRQRLMQQVQFQVTVPSVISIEVGDSFLWSALNLQLKNLNSTAVRWSDDRGINIHRIHTTINPGNWSLEISLAAIQANADLSKFPPTIEYTVKINLLPVSLNNDSCLSFARIPPSFNNVQYLGHTKVTHFETDFLAPIGRPGSTSTVEWSNFTVSETSFFRVWTAPNHIDVDLYLYENDVIVARSITYLREETVMWTLQPNKNYGFRLVYFHWTHTSPYVDPTCPIYRMEVGIAPIANLVNSTCTAKLLNNSGFLPATVSETTQYVSNYTTFSYNQGVNAMSTSISFRVTSGFAYFRAILDYDFIWSDLSLIVRMADGQIVPGANSYSRVDTNAILLAPGNYTLTIYEVKPQFAQYRTCSSFRLFAAIQGLFFEKKKK